MRRHALIAVSMIAVVLMSACAPSTSTLPDPTTSVQPKPTATATPAPPVGFGLPFPAGTEAEIGPLRLHDDNYECMPTTGTTTNCGGGGAIYWLNGAGSVMNASMDLIPLPTPAVGVPVMPLEAGTVLAVWSQCHVVLVDHGSGVWVEYVHLDPSVSVGQQVNVTTSIGVTAAKPNPACGEKSTAPHVHFAFLTGSGHLGTYIPMVGRVLCDHTVLPDASLSGLATPTVPFTVPTCGAPSSGSAPAVATPTASTTTTTVAINRDLPYAGSNDENPAPQLQLILNQVAIDASDNSSMWSFTISNEGASACTDLSISDLQLAAPDGSNHIYPSVAPSSVSIAAGQSASQVATFDVAPTNDGEYTLAADVLGGTCGGASVSNIYQSETLSFTNVPAPAATPAVTTRTVVTNRNLPYTGSNDETPTPQLQLTVDQVAIDATNNTSIWAFTISNTGTSSCTNLTVSNLQLAAPDGSNHSYPGVAPTSVSLVGGESAIQYAIFDVAPATGGQYTLSAGILGGVCGSSHVGLSNTYQTATFSF